MSSPLNESSHIPCSAKAAEGSVRLDDCHSVGSWVNLLILLITSNMGIAHRWALRYYNKVFKERAQFLKRLDTILAAWGGTVILAVALREHSILVLGLLACLVPLLAATHAAICRCASLTTKALKAKHVSACREAWPSLFESAPTVILPFPLPPPRATA
jgi:hypothetical protein